MSPLESLTATQVVSDSIESKSKVVPTRSFGKTGVNVPILSLGSAFSRSSDLLLKQAIDMGVRLWDTAASYAGGNSEKAIGNYFKKFPDDRKKVFLLTKSNSISANRWSRDIDRSLERMNTSNIDLFFNSGCWLC